MDARLLFVRLWIVGLLRLAFLSALILGLAPFPALAQSTVPATGQEVPVVGGEDWWATVQEDIRQSEYEITWQDHTYLASLPAAYQAPNRVHNLRTYFTPEGPVIIPRTWPDETPEPPWQFRLRLVAWGRDGTPVTTSPRQPDPEGHCVEYGDPAEPPAQAGARFVEQYCNLEEGLRQSLTLAAAPAGGQDGAALRIDLSVGGSLAPNAIHEGVGIDLLDDDGQPALRYGALQATDAVGQLLPTWLSVQSSTLSLFVDDRLAVYPLHLEAGVTGLPPVADEALTIDQAASGFGASVATAGDVDGDGFSDVIIGIPWYDGGDPDEGRAQVHAGWYTGVSLNAMWFKESDQANAHFGWSVATAGDVNGDGCAEVIVGAPEYDSDELDEGGAWVYYGSEDGPHLVPDRFYQSNLADARLGASVSTAGDVNGDGYADIIVGAPLYANGQSEEGRVWVWRGSSTGLSVSSNWRAESNMLNGALGVSVSTAGDVDGDGYADVIVGADRFFNGEVEEGVAFVWHGSRDGVNGDVDGTPDNADWWAEVNAEYGRFGSSVSTAGDVNGDGFSDVIVGARYYTHDQATEGGAWIYLGSGGGLQAGWCNHDEGDQATANFGTSVATAGDVNGDGYGDVIVGAPGYTNGSAAEGAAFLWYGHGSPSPCVSASRDWYAEGNQIARHYGQSVATAGDVNGDGYSDIIVGAPGRDDPPVAGYAFVYHGSADSLQETAGWTKASNLQNSYFGLSVATAGDVNGDGFSDVIVGSPWWDGGQAFEGQAWVYLGDSAGLQSAPDWYKQSDEPNAQFGYSVGTAGDVDGDGYDEVIVGAPFWETEGGMAFVYSGSADGLLLAPLWHKASDQQGAQFGFSVGTAGDVDADGYSDVIVGSPYWDSSGDDKGQAWVYHGYAAGLHSAPAWHVAGSLDGARFGYAVATAGDVNRDGYSDVIVGAPYWEDDVVNEGRAHVYHGSPSGLRTSRAWHAESNSFSARLGWSVGTAGDVNGDGYSDVIVGAPFYDDGSPVSEGKVWVFHGSGSGLEGDAAWFKESGRTQAHYGYSVGTAGDVNGDGYSDVVIGAPTAVDTLASEGMARVYHGSAGGLEPTYSWTGSGGQSFAWYGVSVGTAGDVNGDGYADLIVGAHQYNLDVTDEGAAFVYYGGGGRGPSLRPRQVRATGGTVPIAHLGRSDWTSAFCIQGTVHSPYGRGRVKLQVEAKALGTPLTATGLLTDSSWWNDPPGFAYSLCPTGLVAGMPYHWQMRWLYKPGTTPFQPYSRWVTIPWNGRNEEDLSTAGWRVQLPLTFRNY